MHRLASVASSSALLLVLSVLLVLLVPVLLPPHAAKAQEETFVVDVGSDGVDDAPGDSECKTAGGDCTLRAAVQEANALAGMDTILLGEATHSLTLAGADEDAAATGDLDVTSAIVLEGEGEELTSIVQTTAERVIEVRSGGDLLARDLRIEGGTADALALPIGGGVFNGGVLELVGVVVEANSAEEGGGVFNGGTLLLDACTITGNVALSTGPGGGLANGSTGLGFTMVEADIVASALFGNTGRSSEIESANADALDLTTTTIGAETGDALEAVRLYNTTAASLTDVTVLGRLDAGAFDPGGTGLTVSNSALATCSIGTNVTQTNEGVNAARDTSCALGAGAIVSATLGLEPLGDYGGPTPSAPPLRSSALVDAAPSCEAFDQRGEPRPQDGDGDGSPDCDVGAVELPEPGALGALAALGVLGALRRGRVA